MDYHNFPFDLRYKFLDACSIFNECGPNSAGNPQQYVASLNHQNGFYQKLEKSILQHGIRNPILVRAGWCPPSKYDLLPDHMKKDNTEILICDSNGGSRLWVAQNHGLCVPCIVIDYIGRFSDAELLKCRQDVEKKYANVPKIVINEQGMNVTNLPHIHLA